MRCRHCGVSIGELKDGGGKSYGFKHRIEDGPDGYVLCKCKCRPCVGIRDGQNMPCCDGEAAEP